MDMNLKRYNKGSDGYNKIAAENKVVNMVSDALSAAKYSVKVDTISPRLQLAISDMVHYISK